MPTQEDSLRFEHLPSYARFLLDHKLEEFSVCSLRFARELEVPLLASFNDLPEPQLIALFIQGSKSLLEHLADNRGREFIDQGLRTWTQNQLPKIQSSDIVIEDITKGNMARRKLFRLFLPLFNPDSDAAVRLLDEVDRFTTLTQELSLKALFELKDQKISDHHHFIDKINNASPGILYVFDLLEQKEVYTNHKREELLGYTEQEMKAMGNEILVSIIHPDDLILAFEHIQKFADAADGQILTNEYRVRHKLGDYKWHRAYETVFKRTPQGVPAQIIGIALDISAEKEAAQKLELSEHQLREAQDIAEMGSFEWDMEGNKSHYSQQFFKIFDLEGPTNLMSFLDHVHPSDRHKVREAIQSAIQGDGLYESEYRYRKGESEKVIWSRGIITFREGKPVRMNGTVMDVSQRYHMLKKLERSEELHKQAQALTQLGNWSWFIYTDEMKWSDEMYRIFGLIPQSENINFERFIELIDPADRQKRKDALQQSIQTLQPEDYPAHHYTRWS